MHCVTSASIGRDRLKCVIFLPQRARVHIPGTDVHVSGATPWIWSWAAGMGTDMEGWFIFRAWQRSLSAFCGGMERLRILEVDQDSCHMAPTGGSQLKYTLFDTCTMLAVYTVCFIVFDIRAIVRMLGRIFLTMQVCQINHIKLILQCLRTLF